MVRIRVCRAMAIFPRSFASPEHVSPRGPSAIGGPIVVRWRIADIISTRRPFPALAAVAVALWSRCWAATAGRRTSPAGSRCHSVERVLSLIVGIRMLLKGQAPIVVTQNNRLLQSSDATDDAAHRTLRAVHEPLPSAVRLARLDRQQRGLVVQSSFAASAVKAREAGGCIDAGYPISSRNRVATYRGGRSVSCWAALARTITHMPLINRGCRSARRRLAGRSHATRRRHHQCADPAGGVRCPYRVRPKQLRSRRR